MWTHWLHRFVRPSAAGKPAGHRSPRRRPRRLCLERLEDRCVPSASKYYYVTTTADNGDDTNPTPGSLRAAVDAINADTDPAADTIDFSQLPAGVQTFSISNGQNNVMSIQHAVFINGYTKPDSSPNTSNGSDEARITVQLNFELGLDPGADSSTVRGLALPGLEIAASNCTITGNFIGLQANGQPFPAASFVGFGGVFLGFGGTGGNSNLVGGSLPQDFNVISASPGDGVDIFNSSHNIVAGNFIGTDPSGTKPLGNHGRGVDISGTANAPAANNDVGGDSLQRYALNVIAFNGSDAVQVDGDAPGNLVAFNLLSANDQHAYSAAFPIDLSRGGNNDLAAPTLTSATGSVISGTAPWDTVEVVLYANTSADPGGFYEGQDLLGKTQLFGVDANGNLTFTVPVGAPVGSFITALAVDSRNDTSQFSAAVQVEPPDNGAALYQLNALLADQEQILLRLTNPKLKPPSPGLAALFQQIEQRLYADFVHVVTLGLTPGDPEAKPLVLTFLNRDDEIELLVTRLLIKPIQAKEHAAGSRHARVRLRKQVAALEAALSSDLAQDQALAGEFEQA